MLLGLAPSSRDSHCAVAAAAGRCLAALANLEHLTRLNANNNNSWSATAYEAVASLQHLVSLDLCSALSVLDDGKLARLLTPLPRLRTLQISCCSDHLTPRWVPRLLAIYLLSSITWQVDHFI